MLATDVDNTVDPNTDTLTYGLANIPGGTDMTFFAIDDLTGQLNPVLADYDYEASPVKRTYTVLVTVTDGKDAEGNTDPTTVMKLMPQLRLTLRSRT